MQRRGGRAPSRRGARIDRIIPAAIVAAGGLGRRAAGGTGEAKQFRDLGGRPLYEWSLRVLAASGCDPIIIAVPGTWTERLRKPRDVSADVRFVAGGDSRQSSVAHGLDWVDREAVVIHDAARPFISTELVRGVLAALEFTDGAITAVRVGDTLKRVDDGSRTVVETVDRRDLWRSQTPAAFRTAALKEAHSRAARDGFTATDDAQLVERVGGVVAVVEGSEANLKVTWPGDLALADALAKALG